jgi:hypothetical protein
MDKPDIVDAWLANEAFENLQDYLKRGRPLASALLENLNDRWVHLMDDWARAAIARTNADHREREDIQSELKLRKVEPPFERVREALERLRRASEEHFENLRRDPDQLALKESELDAAIEQFKGTAKTTQH